MSRKTKFIGLSGLKRSGKSTTARALTKLLRERGYTVQTIAFAYRLKQICSILCGCSIRDMEQKDELTPFRWKDLEFKSFGKGKFLTRRDLLQFVGTQVFRTNFLKTTWIFLAEQQVKDIDFVIVTDSRFINELQSIKDWGKSKGGSYFVQILRPGQTNDDGHESEASITTDVIKKYKMTIITNDSRKNLKRQLKEFLEHEVHATFPT